MKKYLLLIPFFLPFTANSQESNFGNWMIYIGNMDIGEKFNIHHGVQYRNYNAIGDLQQFVTRVGLGYDLKEDVNIMLGYDYFLNQPYESNGEKININEHRTFQQYLSSGNIGIMDVQARFRLEERFIEDHDVSLRGRAFLDVNIPFKEEGMVDNTVYLSSNIEYFNEFLSPDEFIRLYGGLGYKVNSGLRFEVGYMNQFNYSSPDRDQLHIFAFYNFSLKKKEK